MNRYELIAPDLGNDSVKFSLWLAEVGETVQANDRIAELVFPGATVDLCAEVNGRLAKKLAMPGDPIHPGQTIALLTIDGSS